MALVSPSQSNAGDEITAASINNPVNQIATQVNGNLDATNLANSAVTTVKVADGAVTPAKLQTGTGSTWSWTDYTPTFTNFTLGNGTITYAKYKQLGKTVHVSLLVTMGTTSAMGTQPIFTLPVNAASYYVPDKSYVGNGNTIDTGTADYPALVSIKSSTTAVLFISLTTTTHAQTANITASTPFTWTTGDRWTADFTYEAA